MDSSSRSGKGSLKSRLVEYFRPGKFAKSVGLLAGGTALAQLIRLAAEPVLTRLYSVEDYGVYNAYLTVMSFAAVTACMRLELAIFLPESDEEAASVTVAAIFSSLMIGVVTGVVAAILVSTGVLTGEYSSLNKYAWVFPLSVIGYGLFLSCSFWLSRKKRFKGVVYGKFGQTGGQATAQLTYGALSATPFGLIIGDAAGRLIGSAQMIRDIVRNDLATFKTVSRRSVFELAKRYRQFAFISTPSALINTAAFGVPMLMIGIFYGAATLGIFGLVYRVMSLPAALTTQAVSQVYMSEAGPLAQSNRQSLKALYARTFKKLLLIGFVPHLVVAVFGPSIFAFVFGSEWYEAGEYARLLAIMHYLAFSIGPLQTTLNLIERQKVQFAWDVCRTTLSIGSVYLSWQLGYGATGAVVALSAALSIALLSNVALTYASIGSKVSEVR